MHQGAYLLLLCALLAISVGCVVWLVACSKEVPELVFAEYGIRGFLTWCAVLPGLKRALAGWARTS